MRIVAYALPLFLIAAPAAAEDFTEVCLADGDTPEVCACANEALAEVNNRNSVLYIEVALLSAMNREDGEAASAAYNDAVVEVAGGMGFGVGDVYEIVSQVDREYRAAVAACK
jgi:hypothetical protein